MASYSPFSPVDIRISPVAEGEAAVRSMLYGKARRLLVMVPRQLSAKLALTAFLTALQSDGHSIHLVTDIPANPSVQDIAALLADLRAQEFNPTRILCIGGGSCMDFGKALSALWLLNPALTASTEAVRQAILEKHYLQAANPFISLLAMPTTSGTGSEVTRWATIWDPEKKQKLSIDSPKLFPKAAILIPEWTVSMPAPLTLSTGLDALAHAMEAFWARAATPLSGALALSAVQQVRQYLPQVLNAPTGVSLRQEMCTASLLAGLPFSITRTTACHSLSYPLTLLHGIPHGFAAAVSLPSVLRRNRTALPAISHLEKIFESDGGFAVWLRSLCEPIQPLSLSAFGICESQLPAIAELAFTAGRMDNNPVSFTTAEVLAILRESL